MTLSDYLSLFPGSTREHPRFMALAEAILRQAVDLMDLTVQMQSAFSFESAQGVQLDQLAEAIGLSRNDVGLDVSDETFRQYALAKLALWRWDGTNEGVPAALAGIPGGTEQDNQDGTVTVSYTGMLPVEEKELFPVTAGVKIIHNS